jgi:hypothetical protein
MVGCRIPKTFLVNAGSLEIVVPPLYVTNLKRRISGWQRTGTIVGLLTRAIISRGFLLLHHISLFGPVVIVSAIKVSE